MSFYISKHKVNGLDGPYSWQVIYSVYEDDEWVAGFTSRLDAESYLSIRKLRQEYESSGPITTNTDPTLNDEAILCGHFDRPGSPPTPDFFLREILAREA